MLFEEALPPGGPDPVLTTLSLVQVRHCRERGLGSKAPAMWQKVPEAWEQPEELEPSLILLLTGMGLALLKSPFSCLK